MLGVSKKNFKYLTTTSFILLYKNMVRSHLDYCSLVWSIVDEFNSESTDSQLNAEHWFARIKKL